MLHWRARLSCCSAALFCRAQRDERGLFVSFWRGGGRDALERGLGSSKFSRVVAKPLLAVGKAVDRPVRAGVNRLEDRWGRKGGGGGVPSVCTWPIMGAIQPCGPNTEP